MKQEALQRVRPGFEDPVQDSQAVFRRVLEALSMPGRVVELPVRATLPECQGSAAAAQTLLALLDSKCSLWLSPSLQGSDAEAWLRFHTGCRCVSDPAQAQFLWLAVGDEWPALAALHRGTDESPDQSATCIMEVESISGTAGQAWTLQGPGILGEQALSVRGLSADFEDQWAANHALFPRGVDVLLAVQGQLVGLPRTTRVISELVTGPRSLAAMEA
ncbi:phosphonate C-P lyase system protein PhnH [Ottowia sp. VDI28]|uniref:phosphonate C-P lyase system protein PhnH n=1 Tax=Ottowia sp. VDI28 TaxID=3133968 RepID=UPI003C2FAAE2